MGKRNQAAANPVTLFPFLAVLICAMGALIFLLLVTTRNIRENAIANARQGFPAPPVMAIAPPKQIAPELLPVPVRPPDANRSQAKELAAERAAQRLAKETLAKNRLAEQRVAEARLDEERQRRNARQTERLAAIQLLEQEWQSKALALATREAKLRAAATEQVGTVSESEERVAELQSQRASIESQIEQLESQLGDLEPAGARDAERQLIEKQVAELKARGRQAAKESSTARSKYMVVPFDTQTGTTRRPILIECTANGLKFVPENVTITASDLDGFTERFNPLLAGSQTLVNYWTIRNQQQAIPGEEPQPYVLLLVRPSGTVAYYVAMRMLGTMKQAFGYELIEEGTELAPPPVDPEARAALELTVKRMLQERQAIAAAGGGLGGGGRGETGRFRKFETGQGNLVGGPGAGVAEPGSGTAENLGTGGAPGEAPAGTRVASGGPSGGSRQFAIQDLGVDESGRPIPAEGSEGRSWENPENFGGQKFRGKKGVRNQFEGGSREGKGGAAAPGEGAGSGWSEKGDAEGETIPPFPAGGDELANGNERAATRSKWAKGRNGAKTQSKGNSREGKEEPDRSDSQATGRGDPSDDEFAKPKPGSSRADRELAKSRPGQSGGQDGSPGGDSTDAASNSPPPPNSAGVKMGSQRSGVAIPMEHLAHRKWGQSDPSASIGLEHDVRVELYSDRMVVAEGTPVAVGRGETRIDLVNRLLVEIDNEAQTWGRPSRGFFWVPRVKFVVHPGGNQHYERVQPSLVKAGLATSREFALTPANSTGEGD